MDAGAALDAAYRQHWGRLLALLVGQYRRLDLAEDALSDAFEAAARHWPTDGVPTNPPAWLLTAARRRADRPVSRRGGRGPQGTLLVVDAEHEAAAARVMADVGDVVEDDLLRLVLLCAHPTLTPESASALSLRLVVGVPTRDLARLFLVPEPTMAARLTRARKRLAGADFGIPSPADLPDRLEVVGQVAYLAFTTGYAPGSGRDLLRADVAGEAVRLAAVVHDLLPEQPLPTALLALMLLQHSRRDARSARTVGWCCSPTRTASGGAPTRSPRRWGCSRRWCVPTCAARRGPTCCRPSSPPSTPPPRPRTPRTGLGSPRSTPSSRRIPARPSCG